MFKTHFISSIFTLELLKRELDVILAKPEKKKSKYTYPVVSKLHRPQLTTTTNTKKSTNKPTEKPIKVTEPKYRPEHSLGISYLLFASTSRKYVFVL